MTPAEVLRRASEAYRNGDIQWGQEWFRHPDTNCRCALGAVAYALDPDEPEGNPRYTGPAGHDATGILADHLVDECGAIRCVGEDEMESVIETVAAWNDEPDRTPDEVIAALEAASERAA